MINPRHASPKIGKVCVVSDSIDPFDHISREGPSSMIGLAQKLASSGLEVTLYLTAADQNGASDQEQKLTLHLTSSHNIKVEKYVHAKDNIHRYDGIESRSLGVYTYLKNSSFDVVYFALEGGLPYYSLLSKEVGLKALRSLVVIIAHAPLEWTSQADRFFFERLEQAKIAFMERYCVKQADRLVTFNSALIDWFRKNKWDLPKFTSALPAIAPSEWHKFLPQSFGGSSQATRELVLIAGNRYRDGTTLFCDALDELAKVETGDLDITIIGEFGKILGEHSGGMFVRRARRWPFRLNIQPRMTILQGIRYAASRNSIAVISSFESATGFYVSECIRLGVRFIATAVGGNLNQMPPDQEKKVLTRPNAADLASRLKKVLSETVHPILKFDESERASLWISHHRECEKQLARATRERPGRRKSPLVSVIITHHDRPQYLTQVVASIRDQDYKNLEVILVDDGSKLPESLSTLDRLERDFSKRGWKIIRGENRYVGAARNTGVKISRGEFIVFVDDDNALFPHAVSTFVNSIQHSKADVCMALAKTFYDVYVPGSPDNGYVSYVPLGGSLDLGFLTNCFGDTISIYRRSVFDKVGYQFEKFGYMVEDHEFFVRILLAGLKMRLIPECLFWYRVSTRGRYRSSHFYDNQIPIMEAYRKHNFKGMTYIYDLFVGQNMGTWQTESFRSNLYYSPSDRDYLNLCELEPNSKDAILLLAQIAARESRPETAIGLLAAGRIDGFADLTKSALATDQESEAALVEFGAPLVMTRPVKESDFELAVLTTSKPAAAMPMSYLDDDASFFLEVQNSIVSVATISAVCPASTISVLSKVSLQQKDEASIEFMILLCPMHEDPVVAVLSAGQQPSEGNSGWISVSQPWSPAAIEAKLAIPSRRPLNLVLAARATQSSRAKLFGCFSETAIRISAHDQVTRRVRTSPISHDQRAKQWTDAQRRGVRLVTSYPSELPLLLLPKTLEEGIFLRPSEFGPVVAMLDGIFPPFARSVTARIEISHEAAGPFEFAIAAFLPGTEVQWQKAGPRNSLAFSGWTTISRGFVVHDVATTLSEKIPGSLSIAIAVRLPRGSKPSPANAFFRKLIFSWQD